MGANLLWENLETYKQTKSSCERVAMVIAHLFFRIAFVLGSGPWYLEIPKIKVDFAQLAPVHEGHQLTFV